VRRGRTDGLLYSEAATGEEGKRRADATATRRRGWLVLVSFGHWLGGTPGRFGLVWFGWRRMGSGWVCGWCGEWCDCDMTCSQVQYPTDRIRNSGSHYTDAEIGVSIFFQITGDDSGTKNDAFFLKKRRYEKRCSDKEE
jgi:hypothetical protein